MSDAKISDTVLEALQKELEPDLSRYMSGTRELEQNRDDMPRVELALERSAYRREEERERQGKEGPVLSEDRTIDLWQRLR